MEKGHRNLAFESSAATTGVPADVPSPWQRWWTIGRCFERIAGDWKKKKLALLERQVFRFHKLLRMIWLNLFRSLSTCFVQIASKIDVSVGTEAEPTEMDSMKAVVGKKIEVACFFFSLFCVVRCTLFYWPIYSTQCFSNRLIMRNMGGALARFLVWIVVLVPRTIKWFLRWMVNTYG